MRRKGPAAAAGEDDARGLGFTSKAPYEGGAGKRPAGYRQITSKYGHPGAWFQTPHKGHGHFETAFLSLRWDSASSLALATLRAPSVGAVRGDVEYRASSECMQTTALPCPG
jgi:hypothetical protein